MRIDIYHAAVFIQDFDHPFNQLISSMIWANDRPWRTVNNWILLVIYLRSLNNSNDWICCIALRCSSVKGDYAAIPVVNILLV
jgi:hypothetical protein